MSNIPVYKFALREDLKDDNQFMPTRGEPKATGWDVRAAFPDRKTLLVGPFQHVKIPLGIRGLCPDGWWYEMKPRSSTFAKKNLHTLYGTIDETYEGELIFACQYIPTLQLYKPEILYVYGIEITKESKSALEINFGDAIGQIIPIRRQEMEVQKISNEEINDAYKQRAAVRGAGGFGSTGK